MSELRLGNLTFEEIADAGGMITFRKIDDQENTTYELSVCLWPLTPESAPMKGFSTYSLTEAAYQFEGADVRKHLEDEKSAKIQRIQDELQGETN
jgi:hypothetical protein